MKTKKRFPLKIARFVAFLAFLASVSAGLICPVGAESVGADFHPPLEGRLLLDRDYFHALIDEINNARTEIVFCAYLFKTIENADGYPERVMKSLASAVKRGVRIFALMELNQNSGNLIQTNEETAERLRKMGITVCPDPNDLVTHTKLVVIDRRYLFIGSHNLTQSALKYNHELSVLLDAPSMAEEALRYVDSICRKKTQENGIRGKRR
jgi:phosphatidylserine/phosphatidylglycerophosphate/cardiolipin synthase-like enzyme